MDDVVTVTTLLFAAINALAAVILANHKGLWVSGREFLALKEQYAKLEGRVGELETKLERQHERFLESVQAGHRMADVAHTNATVVAKLSGVG